MGGGGERKIERERFNASVRRIWREKRYNVQRFIWRFISWFVYLEREKGVKKKRGGGGGVRERESSGYHVWEGQNL